MTNPIQTPDDAYERHFHHARVLGQTRASELLACNLVLLPELPDRPPVFFPDAGLAFLIATAMEAEVSVRFVPDHRALEDTLVFGEIELGALSEGQSALLDRPLEGDPGPVSDVVGRHALRIFHAFARRHPRFRHLLEQHLAAADRERPSTPPAPVSRMAEFTFPADTVVARLAQLLDRAHDLAASLVGDPPDEQIVEFVKNTKMLAETSQLAFDDLERLGLPPSERFPHPMEVLVGLLHVTLVATAQQCSDAEIHRLSELRGLMLGFFMEAPPAPEETEGKSPEGLSKEDTP